MDALSFFVQRSRDGELSPLDWHGRQAFLVNEPRLAQKVLENDAGDYLNPPHAYAELRPWLTPAGRLFQGLDRGATQACPRSDASLGGAETLISTLLQRLFAEVDPRAQAATSLRLVSGIKVFMLDLFTELLFGVRMEHGARDFYRAAELAERESLEPTLGRDAAMGQAYEAQHAYAQALLEASGSKGCPPIDGSKRRAVIRSLLNGYNALATNALWTLDALGRAPELRERLATECARLGAPLTFKDVGRIALLRQVISETQRLRPPAWLLGRTSLRAHELGRFAIAKGALVYVCPYTLHRHPEHWEVPERFEPARFEDPRASKNPAFVPFGGGSRACPAQAFAGPTLSFFLANWMRRYDFRSVGACRPWPLISLRPFPDVELQLTLRAGHRMADAGS